MKLQFKIVLVFLIIFINACATYKPQFKNNKTSFSFPDKNVAHSFYLIGDGGNSPIGFESEAIKDFKEALNKASKNSTILNQ